MSPFQRVSSYVRQFRRSYVQGIAFTLAYGALFQMPPVLTGELAGRIERGEGPDEIREAVLFLIGATLVWGCCASSRGAPCSGPVARSRTSSATTSTRTCSACRSPTSPASAPAT